MIEGLKEVEKVEKKLNLDIWINYSLFDVIKIG